MTQAQKNVIKNYKEKNYAKLWFNKWFAIRWAEEEVRLRGIYGGA